MRGKMKIRNDQLGELDIEEDSIIEMPEGLVGFENQNRFYLIRREEYLPFLWMVSVSDPNLCFAVVDPDPFVTEPYTVVLNEAERAELDLREGDPVHVLVIASPGDAPGEVTLNLKGPLLLNPRNRVMRQLLVYSSRLPLRHPVDGAVWDARSSARRTTVRIMGKRAA